MFEGTFPLPQERLCTYRQVVFLGHLFMALEYFGCSSQYPYAKPDPASQAASKNDTFPPGAIVASCRLRVLPHLRTMGPLSGSVAIILEQMPPGAGPHSFQNCSRNSERNQQ